MAASVAGSRPASLEAQGHTDTNSKSSPQGVFQDPAANTKSSQASCSCMTHLWGSPLERCFSKKAIRDDPRLSRARNFRHFSGCRSAWDGPSWLDLSEVTGVCLEMLAAGHVRHTPEPLLQAVPPWVDICGGAARKTKVAPHEHTARWALRGPCVRKDRGDQSIAEHACKPSMSSAWARPAAQHHSLRSVGYIAV